MPGQEFTQRSTVADLSTERHSVKICVDQAPRDVDLTSFDPHATESRAAPLPTAPVPPAPPFPAAQGMEAASR